MHSRPPLVLLCIPLTAWLLPLTSWGAEPTAADVKVLAEKFQSEREQAVKAKFPQETLLLADELAKRAQAAAAAEDYKTAARQIRDARWQLPYLPPGLPDHVVRVFGESRLRHADRINQIAYSPDGARLASCSKDGTVKIWDLDNGREVVTYRGHLDQPDDPTKNSTNPMRVTAVAFHPTQKLIASACGNQVHVWDPQTGQYKRTLLHLWKGESDKAPRSDHPIKPIAFSPNGKSLAVGGDDGVLRVVEFESGKVTYTSPSRNSRIESLAYSPDGSMIVVGDNNSQIAIYAPSQTNPLLMSVNGIDVGGVQGVAFTADGSAVFACGQDVKVRLTAAPKLDGSATATTATRLREFAGHSRQVNALALIPQRGLLVTGSADYSVRVWEVTSAKQLRVFQGHQSNKVNPDSNFGVTAVAARPDGRQIASGSDDGGMRLWDLNDVDDNHAFTEATDSLWTVAYSPDGKRLGAAGNDKIIRVYNAETFKLEAALSGAKSPITSLAFFPDSNRLASGGGDQDVVVWDVSASRPLATLKGHESAILSVAVTDQGDRVVSTSADHTLRCFSLDSPTPLWTWKARSAVCAAAVQPGSKIVAAGLADGTLLLLDVSGPAPKEIFSQPSHIAGIASLAFSPRGDRLATVGGDGALRIWTVGEKGSVASLARFEGQVKAGGSVGSLPLTGVAFMPDGRYVATVGADKSVRIWDVETKTEARSFHAHTDWVTAVAFSPNGRFVASVGVEKDKALRVFELPPLESSPTRGHVLKVTAVAVSQDGRLAATAGSDQTIRVWDVATGREAATLIGNADTPSALTFLDDNALVLGGMVQTASTGRLHFWSIEARRQVKSVATGMVYTAAASTKGARLAVWAMRAAPAESEMRSAYEIYDSRGELLDSTPEKARNVKAVTFTSELDWAVVGDDRGNVAFWDLARKQTIGSDWPLFTTSLKDLGISPDKKLLIAANDRGVVSVADVQKRHVIASFTPHKSGVYSVLASPAGKSFITISNDNDREVKAWSLDPSDLKQPKPIRTWTLPVTVNAAAYTPDGKHLVTGNSDGTAYVLELP